MNTDWFVTIQFQVCSLVFIRVYLCSSVVSSRIFAVFFSVYEVFLVVDLAMQSHGVRLEMGRGGAQAIRLGRAGGSASARFQARGKTLERCSKALRRRSPCRSNKPTSATDRPALFYVVRPLRKQLKNGVPFCFPQISVQPQYCHSERSEESPWPSRSFAAIRMTFGSNTRPNLELLNFYILLFGAYRSIPTCRQFGIASPEHPLTPVCLTAKNSQAL